MQYLIVCILAEQKNYLYLRIKVSNNIKKRKSWLT